MAEGKKIKKIKKIKWQKETDFKDVHKNVSMYIHKINYTTNK